MNNNTQQAISLRILAMHALGFPVPESFDAVIGTGAYARLAGEVYDALRTV